MDATIWRIRPSMPTDPSEKILLSVRALTEPVSLDIVRCKSNQILHLTDLHYATGANRDQHIWRYDSETDRSGHTMADAIKTALGNHKIGLVIASGDFTFVGSSEEFARAKNAISHLLGILDHP